MALFDVTQLRRVPCDRESLPNFIVEAGSTDDP